jgi:hypothetical protein
MTEKRLFNFDTRGNKTEEEKTSNQIDFQVQDKLESSTPARAFSLVRGGEHNN